MKIKNCIEADGIRIRFRNVSMITWKQRNAKMNGDKHFNTYLQNKEDIQSSTNYYKIE